MELDLRKFMQYGQVKNAEIEIFYQENQEDSVEVRDQKVEKLNSALDKGLAVRVIKDQKLGFSYTTSLQEADILKTIDQALTAATYTATDPFWSFPKPAKIQTKQKLNIFDPAIAKMPMKNKVVLAQKMEKAAYALDKRVKKTESASFSSGVVHSYLLNSKGVRQAEKRTYCGAMLEVIAQEKKEMEAGTDYQFVTNLKDLDYLNVGETAARKATMMLAAQEIHTGDYDLVLTPQVSINFLSVLASMFCADNVQKNKSLLQNKLKQKIAASLVTLIDDPLLKKGLVSSFADAEGTPTYKKILIKNGVLQGFLFDTYTANKGQTRSTGNAARHSLFGEPEVGPSNLYIKPGTKTQKQLLAQIKHGLLIHNVMGLHTADPISGQFSLGASGLIVENGKLKKAVKNIAIAGNLIEFLEKISALGSDLTFMPDSGCLGAPSLVIKNIKVAGNK